MLRENMTYTDPYPPPSWVITAVLLLLLMFYCFLMRVS